MTTEDEYLREAKGKGISAVEELKRKLESLKLHSVELEHEYAKEVYKTHNIQGLDPFSEENKERNPEEEGGDQNF